MSTNPLRNAKAVERPALELPYCRECGSKKLRYDYECASGHVYQCKECGHEMQWTQREIDA